MVDNDKGHLKIGELASEVGVNPRTIRYYERIGLLPEPERTATGYRIYDVQDRERLGFIRKAKTMGLTLEEIGEILSLRAEGCLPCHQVLALMEGKIAAIDEQLRALGELRAELIALREEARGVTPEGGTVCRLIEAHDRRHG